MSKKKPMRKPAVFRVSGSHIASCHADEVTGRRVVVVTTPLKFLRAKAIQRLASWSDRAAAWCSEERRKGGVRARS